MPYLALPLRLGVCAGARVVVGSIFRRVVVIIRSVYHDGTTLVPTKPLVLKSGPLQR